jgi:WD40 repeat protein
VILYAFLLALIVAGLLFGFPTVGVISAVVTGLLLLVGTAWFVHFRWSQPALKRNQVEAAANRPPHIMFASFLPNGQILIVTSNGAIERYAVEPWTRLRHIDSLPPHASLHALGADGRFLAWAIQSPDDEGASVSLSEIETGNRVRTVEFGEYLNSALISPDGAIFGQLGHLKDLYLWEARTGEPVSVFSDCRSHAVSFRCAALIAFSPNSRFLSACDEDAVYIWDFRSKELVQVLGDHSNISALSYSPDGMSLAVADDGNVHLWDVESGEKVRVIEGLHGVQQLSFSPDGRFLAGDNNTGTL